MKSIEIPRTDNLVKNSLHAAVVVTPDVIKKFLNVLDTGKTFEEIKSELVSATTNKPSFSKYQCKAKNTLHSFRKGQGHSETLKDVPTGLPIAEPVAMIPDPNHLTRCQPICPYQKCHRCALLHPAPLAREQPYK